MALAELHPDNAIRACHLSSSVSSVTIEKVLRLTLRLRKTG